MYMYIYMYRYVNIDYIYIYIYIYIDACDVRVNPRSPTGSIVQYTTVSLPSDNPEPGPEKKGKVRLTPWAF